MDALSAAAIVNLPLNEKEDGHPGRIRKAYHVYLSRFFMDFKELSVSDKDEFFNLYSNIVNDGDNNDDDSEVNSLDTPPRPNLMRVAGLRWRVMPPNSRGGWQQRANWLNSRPIPGKFLSFPDGACDHPEVLNAMTLDWARMVSLFRTCVTRRQKQTQSSVSVFFGKEKVHIINQSYRRFEVNELIRLCLFGKDLGKLRVDEVVLRSKKMCLIHIASEQRMRNLFTQEGLCASSFMITGFRHTCSGKVNTMKDGKNCIGYIVDESANGNVWRVQLVTNKMCSLTKPPFESNVGKYQYSDPNEAQGRVLITEYWPIRILLLNSGHGRLSLNRVTFDNADKIVLMKSS
jgi:hypothetical protein